LKRDPTRLLNVASGGNFWPVGHFADNHNYPLPSFPAPANNNNNNARNNGGSDGFGGSSNVWSNGLEAPNFNDFVKVVGEFGGHGLPLAGHLWREDSDEASASNGGGMVGSGSGDNKQGSQNWGYGKVLLVSIRPRSDFICIFFRLSCCFWGSLGTASYYLVPGHCKITILFVHAVVVGGAYVT
jgi:hypothetical protein